MCEFQYVVEIEWLVGVFVLDDERGGGVRCVVLCGQSVSQLVSRVKT